VNKLTLNPATGAIPKPSKVVKVKKRKYTIMEKKTAQQLIHVADEVFSRYIRLRDSAYDGIKWVGDCITCERFLIVINEEGKWVASSQNGHFITRGIMSLRFDELNTNLQCAHCNAWMDKEEMLERYRKGLDLKYGKDTAKELKRLSKLPTAFQRPTKPELLQIIADAKTSVGYMLAHNV
jgi:hypothetical protein